MSCSRTWQAQAIDEARLGDADIAAFARHTQSCATCRQAQAAFQDLHQLARELPGHTPNELDVRRLRARVLHDAMSAPAATATRPAVAWLLIAAAVVAVTLFILRGQTKAAPFAASVHPDVGASWSQARHDGVERVILRDGELTLQVRKQDRDERFLVVVPDGEVEVRGTTFEVAVHGGITTRVHVDEGIVIVRVKEGATLTSGESWPRIEPVPAVAQPAPLSVDRPPVMAVTSSPSAVTSDAPAPPRIVHAVSRTLPSERPPPQGPPPQGAQLEGDREGLRDYEAAVAAYRAGRYEEAAELLHAFSLGHASSSFLDDASFLEASSLANAGRHDAAALLAERHLARFPSSFHRKEAAILVARLRRDRGDCDGARKAVAVWMSESPKDSRVTSALGGCGASAEVP